MPVPASLRAIRQNLPEKEAHAHSVPLRSALASALFDDAHARDVASGVADKQSTTAFEDERAGHAAT
jgi:hypothetical protein